MVKYTHSTQKLLIFQGNSNTVYRTRTAAIGIHANSCLLKLIHRYPDWHSYQCERGLKLWHTRSCSHSFSLKVFGNRSVRLERTWIRFNVKLVKSPSSRSSGRTAVWTIDISIWKPEMNCIQQNTNYETTSSWWRKTKRSKISPKHDCQPTPRNFEDRVMTNKDEYEKSVRKKIQILSWIITNHRHNLDYMHTGGDTLWNPPFSQLLNLHDLGLGHMAHLCVALIDRHQHTKFRSKWKNSLWMDARTDGWALLGDSEKSTQ